MYTLGKQNDWEGIEVKDDEGKVVATITGATPEFLAEFKAIQKAVDEYIGNCEDNFECVDAYPPCGMCEFWAVCPNYEAEDDE